MRASCSSPERANLVAGRAERLLVRLDEPPLDSIHRFAAGFVFLPVLALVRPDAASDWGVLVYFGAMLLGWRVVPAVCRKFAPFSPAALATWRERRFTAKAYDSYQWRKLFWIGLGLMTYMVARGTAKEFDLLLTAFCLASGALGALVWRTRHRRSNEIGLRSNQVEQV